MNSIDSTLPHDLSRVVIIRATPATVFRFFTDSARWATWWGAGSTIDARVGGAVNIQYPGGIAVAGEVLDIQSPKHIVFTYGFVSGKPIAAGSSRVTIALAAHPAGTQLTLRHEFADADAKVRDEHVQGWRYQLSIFANVVSDEANNGAAAVVDAWFDAWADADVTRRENSLKGVVSPDVQFSDRYSNLDSLADVLAHITASQRFMPGVRMRRSADVRHCQGMVLADWTATGADDKPLMHGTNVFVFGPTGTLESVTGFSRPA